MSVVTPQLSLRRSQQALGNTQLERVGNTPLVRLDRIAEAFPGVQILGKAEWVNPGGSVKDRPALNIVREAERNGQLYDGRTLLDATSGNTGIAYAMIGAARGFPVELCMPSNVSHERKRMLKAYGAEVVFTDPNDGSDGVSAYGAVLKALNSPGEFVVDSNLTQQSVWGTVLEDTTVTAGNPLPGSTPAPIACTNPGCNPAPPAGAD